MSNRKEITKALTLSLKRYINPKNDPRIYTAREVTFDYATGHSVRVDYMWFKPVNNFVSGIEKGDFYCYEVKSSVEDFHSKNGHNFIGDFNYYVMPADVYEKVQKEVPWRVGVFVSSMEEDKGLLKLKLIKKAMRSNRERPVSEMLLMMFRSCARDVIEKVVVPEIVAYFGNTSEPENMLPDYRCPKCGYGVADNYVACPHCASMLDWEHVKKPSEKFMELLETL